MVDSFTNGELGPDVPMLGPVADGGHIVFNSTPGCWGPMITPAIRSGHEVTRPVAVAGAEAGDAIAIRIRGIHVTSLATASGVDRRIDGRFDGDPYCAAVCPGCGAAWPQTTLAGIGPAAVRCAMCGAEASPFAVEHGYSIAFDERSQVGVTVPDAAATGMARDAARWQAIPDRSIQHPILAMAPHDLVGVATRMRPFLGQLGTSPSITMPDSRNARDFGSFLVGASHRYALTQEEVDEHTTDGHMDIDAVRAGATIVCPVKLGGAGVYAGDMHALQGDGEIAGHTCDVAGITIVQVEVLKGLELGGPVLLPCEDDLPPLARELTASERRSAERLARRHGIASLEETAPISVVGSAHDLNAATDTALARAGALLDMPVAEVRNRATLTGAVEIGRLPGVVHVTLRAPLERLEACGLARFCAELYG
jgi:acetamidase/formamidase